MQIGVYTFAETASDPRTGRVFQDFTVGSIAHDKVMRSIELLGTNVAPAVRSALGRSDG